MNSLSRIRTVMFGLLISVTLLSHQSHAVERGDVELGVDAELSYTMFPSASGAWEQIDRPGLYALAVPSRIRIGTYLSDNTSLEFIPSIALLSRGNSSNTRISFGVGLGLHTPKKSSSSVQFFEPILTFAVNSSNGRDFHQVAAGFEAGVKRFSSTGLAGRYSVFIDHGFETDKLLSYTTIGFRFGLSFVPGRKLAGPDFR